MIKPAPYAGPPAAAPAYASAHPLVLCAAGAIIIACLTAIAAMLGWLPTPHLSASGEPGRAAAVVSSVPAAPLPATVLRAAEAPATVLQAAEAPAAVTPEPVPEPTPAPPAPQSSGMAEGAALAAAAAGAAGAIGSAQRSQAASPPVKRTRPAPRRRSQEAPAYAQQPRQVGSVEVPVVEFVGTKTREQVIAEMVAARRAANRQPSNSGAFQGFGSPAARR